MEDLAGPFFLSQSSSIDEGPPIDLLNDETFGSGAVDDDWEDSHDNYVEQQSRVGSIGSSSKLLDDDELELANRQLAAAVEELVLNSDQDQDVIDPAIVSLRKESRHAAYSPRLTKDLVSPYMGDKNPFGRSTPSYSSQSSTSSSVFQTDGMRNIWSSSDYEVQESLSKSSSMVMERQLLNEKLQNMIKKSNANSDFEDGAIVTAVKASSPSTQENWNALPPHEDILRKMFGQQPSMLRAEDLEKEFSKGDLRGPSPTFGISIPKNADKDHDDGDRSLPARSISPVIGSPTSHALPIGTPPKHVTDFIQQAQKQGMGFSGRHPGQPPAGAVPVHQRRPPSGFVMQPGRGMPPGNMGPNMWPPGIIRSPMNPLIAQDMMKKLRMGMVGSPPANMSPIGSPRFMQPQRFLQQRNMGLSPHAMRTGPVPIGMHGPMPRIPPHPNRRMPMPMYPPMLLGPGHLHPEHSRFVRMRRQQRGHNRQYDNRNHRHHHRDGGSRDPYSNLMTSREKEWVIKIQMMALQSDRPEIDDYYYQHYIEKKLEEGKLSLEENSEQKRLITPTTANPDHKKYVPVQYDNSLGKLTVSSVYSPRQIIDVIHAEKEEDTAVESVNVGMSMNKRLEIYRIIENSYSALLELEEIQFRAAANSHIGKQDEDKTEGVENEKNEHYFLRKLEDLLFSSNSSDIVAQCLRLRKGKRLICRALPQIPHENALKTLLTLIKQLPTLMKKDQRENLLQEFYVPMCQILDQMESGSMVAICNMLTPISNTICRDKFGLSILCKVIIMMDENIDMLENASHKETTWEPFVLSCYKAFLSFGEKKKAVIPAVLENGLDTEAIKVLEKHSKLYPSSNTGNPTHIQEIKDLFSRRRSSALPKDVPCS